MPSYKDLIPGEQFCQMFYLNNTTPDTFEITKLILNDDPRHGVQWSFKYTMNFPVKLGPTGVLAIELCALIPLGDTTALTGSLDIVQQTQCGQTDTGILQLHGFPASSAQASVTEASSQSSGFSINPNPSHADVTISLPSGNNSTVEIYDVLGNLVLRKVASGEFVWNPESSNGAANGAFIVRVTERGADGASVVSSKRLLLVR